MIRSLVRHRASLLLVILVLAAAAIAQAIGGRDRSGAPLSSHDSEDDGALALAMWLERLEHRVERYDRAGFSLQQVGLLFVLAPVRSYEHAEAVALLDWVRRGGVLVYLPRRRPYLGLSPTGDARGDPLNESLSLGIASARFAQSVQPVHPFFSDPPGSEFVLDSFWALELEDDGWTPLIQDERGRALVATRALDRGRVYATTVGAFFSNSGLPKADNSALVLNILARHPVSGSIAFDEYHHSPIAAPTLASVARNSPWGWALGYAALVGFAFILWGGRRFGPPAVPETPPPRSSGEYIGALAGLLQRARAVDWAQGRYAGLVRRRIARSLGVRADLPAGDLARIMAERRREVDAGATEELLSAIEGTRLSERGLLTRMRALEGILRQANRGGA